jgi:predicted nucleic-acid-binding protein
VIAVDTNVLVRLIVNDDAGQTARARAAMLSDNVAITSGVLIETVWVLDRTYGLEREAIARSLQALLALPNVVTPWPSAVAALLAAYKGGFDFADAAHMLDAKVLGCRAVISFDKQMIKQATKTALGIDVQTP